MIAGRPADGPRFSWRGSLLVVLILLYLLVDVVLVVRGMNSRPSDFSAYYYPAARAVLTGRSPYSVVGLNYPPLLSFLLLPLAALPAAWARFAWFGLSQAFVVAAAGRAWWGLGRGQCAGLVVAGAWAASGALFLDLREGQINTLLLLLVVFVFWPSEKGRWAAPAALGGAVALKLWPAVLLLGDVLRGRWRMIMRSCGVAALGFLVPWFLVMSVLAGPAAPTRADFWAGSPGALNGSLPGLALRLLDRPVRGATLPLQWIAAHNVGTFRASTAQAAVSVGVAVFVLAVGTAVVARRTRSRGDAASPALLCAGFIGLALLAAPVVWPHYHVLELPGVALLSERFIRRRAWPRLAALAAASLASTWAAPLMTGPYLGHFGLVVVSPLFVWTLSSLMPAGALVIWLLVVAELGRDARPSFAADEHPLG